MSAVNDVGTWQDLGVTRHSERSERKELGQEEFLRLLVTQINNQDPMNPMESAEFMSQMTQFASLDSLQRLQASFNSLAESLRSSQALSAAALIGKSVLVPGNVGALAEGAGISGAVDVPLGTTSVGINIYDASGAFVRRLELGTPGAGAAEFHWDGLDADGNAMPPGSYRIESDGLVDGGRQGLETLIAAPVESVTLNPEGGETMLNLRGLDPIALNDVWRIM